MSARRNTGTGGVLERMVLPALDQGGYSYRVQVHIGQRLGCGQHNVEVLTLESFVGRANAGRL